MPVIVRGTEVVVRPVDEGITVQSLLSPDTIGSDHVKLDLVSIETGASIDLTLDGDAIGWLQVLDGAGHLKPGLHL